MDFSYVLKTFQLALAGTPVTLKITFVSLILATPFAFFMALATIYRVPFFKQLSGIYISYMRAVPMVLQIIIIYSFLPSLINQFIKQSGSNVDIFQTNPIIYAYIVFTLTTIGSLSEIFRSAILTVKKGELEAALAIGLSTFQAYRRIVIPQALVVALPNLCNLTLNIIKGTSLVFLMTIKDITAIAKIEASYGYKYIESYLVIFILYILICGVVEYLFKLIEKKLARHKLNYQL